MSINLKKFVSDSWENILTKLGTAEKDKRVNAQAIHYGCSQGDAEEIFASDPIAKKMAAKIATDGTRDFIEYYGDENLENKLNDLHEGLKTRSKFCEAWIDANVYGGSVLLMTLDDQSRPQDWANPVDFNALKNIKSLIKFNRYEVTPQTFCTNLFDADYGKPDTYMITPRLHGISSNKESQPVVTLTVHKSRLLIFQGEYLPQTKLISNQFWHDSVFSSRKNELQSYHQVHDSIAHVLTDFRQNVLKIAGLAEMVGNEESNDLLVKRIQQMNLTRSIMSTFLIDADGEEFTQNTPTLTGIKDLMSSVDSCLVASSNMPHTILLGESPQGKLGSDGKAEQRDYFNQVRSEQVDKIASQIEQLHKIICACKQGPTSGQSFPDDFGWDFVSLYKQTPEEESTIRKNMSEADKNYLEQQVITAEEVRKSRFSGKYYSIETTLDDVEIDIEESEKLLSATTTHEAE